MALLREKTFKQRTQIIWINTETYLHFLEYPNSKQIHLLHFHLAHVKFQTHAKNLLGHAKFVESRTTHSVRTPLRAGLFVHTLEFMLKMMALYKVVPKEKIS